MSSPPPSGVTRRDTSRPQTPPRRRQAARQVIQHILQQLPPQDLESLSSQIKNALETPIVSASEPKLVADLAGSREHPATRRVELELTARARACRLRQELLADSLTAPEVAALLNTSRQTPHDRIKKGTLLGVLDRGMLRFPVWQLDPDG